MNKKLTIEDFKILRVKEGFSCSQANWLDFFKSSSNITGAQEMSNHYFNLEKECNDENSEMTDMFYFNVLGTSPTANILYDCVESSIGFQIEHFFVRHTPSWLMTLMDINALGNVITFVKYGKRVMLHYMNLIKDFFLLRQIWTC